MKLKSIAFTDDISGLASSSDLVASAGELKIMTAEYDFSDSCVSFDNTYIEYFPAIAVSNPQKPSNDNNKWVYTVTPATVVGTFYDMQLLIDGVSTGVGYYASKNYTVRFKRLTDKTFIIEHRFVVTDDVGQLNEFGTNYYERWFGIKDNRDPNNQGGGLSMYDTTKYFSRYLRVTDIATSQFTDLIDFNPIEAVYFDESIYISNLSVVAPITVYVVGDITLTRVQFNNVDGTKTPTSAKLMLVNDIADSQTTAFMPSIVESSVVGTLVNVVANTWTIQGNLTALTTLPKKVVALVYYSAIPSVGGSKIGTFTPMPNGPITAIRGCYPVITKSYDDYNSNFSDCIESTVYERITPKFTVSKTSFAKIGIGSPLSCFPNGFDTYDKSGTFTLKRRSDGLLLFSESFSYNATSMIWSTGTLTFSDSAGLLNFSYLYRNLFDYSGDYVDATLTFNIHYTSTYFETVVSQSSNKVLGFDQALGGSIIESVEILDVVGGAVIDSMIGNIMTIRPTCLTNIFVKVCRKVATLADDYNIIAVLYEKGTNAISEEETYASGTGMSELSSPYFDNVPVSFGVGTACKTFNLDVSTLDYYKTYEVAIIIKKI